MKYTDATRQRINEKAGRLHELSREILGLDWFDVESQARRLIEELAEREELLKAIVTLALAEPTPVNRAKLREMADKVRGASYRINHDGFVETCERRACREATRVAELETENAGLRTMLAVFYDGPQKYSDLVSDGGMDPRNKPVPAQQGGDQ